MLRVFPVLSIILMSCLAALPLAAQDATCGPLEAVLAGLSDRYGETVRVDALMASGNLLLITASESGGWTALAVTPDMTACVVSFGQGFGAHEPDGEDT